MRMIRHADSSRKYTIVDKVLKQLLLVAIEVKYYRVLRNNLIGYTSVATRDLIKHIDTSYSNIASTQLADNDVKLRSTYDYNQLIESVYEQIDNTITLPHLLTASTQTNKL